MMTKPIDEQLVVKELPAGLTDEQFAALSRLGDTSPKELRRLIYSHVPEKSWQIQRFKRGYLIARLFDLYLEGKVII